MRIHELSITNLRSIVSSDSIPISHLFALVGENNAGKSNVLLAVGAFLTGGAGGLKEEDFNNPDEKIILKIIFDELTGFEAGRWRKYLVGGQLILEKHIWIEIDPEAETRRIKSSYHGYEAPPADWFLSIEQIIEQHGNRPDWTAIAVDNGLPNYFLEEGKSNKATYSKALARYLDETDIAYGEPDVSATHALGLQSKVIASLPAYYILPAITDYSSEIDKRQKSSTFRRLMGELSERILKKDPRFAELENALSEAYALLNKIAEGAKAERLAILGTIEEQIGATLKQLMPSVSAVKLAVQIDEIKELFSDGVELAVDDGVETNVLAKGHGLQRCIVFSLLKTLIETERVIDDGGEVRARSIILGIEEPELYIHPQLSKLFYDVMRAFGDTDQILYTTHSPLFVDAYNYSEVAIVSKPNIAVGTKIKTASPGIFDGLDDGKIFKGLARFNPAVSELFFAKKVLVVEGPEDLMAVTETLVKLGKIKTRTEEIEWTILVAGGKEAIPFLQMVMNAFEIPYAILHDTDIDATTPPDKAANHTKTNDRISALLDGRPLICFPHKLETTLGIAGHLQDQYRASQFFSDHGNINAELEGIVNAIFS